MERKNILYIFNFFLLFFSIAVALTGIIKFPGLLQLLNIDQNSLPLGIYTSVHDWLGLAIVGLSFIHLILHWKWIKAMTESIWKENKNLIILLCVIALLFLRISAGFSANELPNHARKDETNGVLPEGGTSDAVGNIDDTQPFREGEITINGVGRFNFDPMAVETIRPDIFNNGYFSLFDILVHLDIVGEITLDYEFRPDLDTHVINSINGIERWWYTAHYDGGWVERNVWRMDLFPYKDRTFFELDNKDEEFLNRVYTIFNEEVRRREKSGGKYIIPEVIIRGNTFEIMLNNVTVEPHNLRNDYYIEGTVTAIDVILSLSEAGEITHELNWYESIGSVGIVKNYFVDAINGDRSAGRCGFVYETGSPGFYGFYGNHIHIPSDLRVLTSPEYVEFYWICI